MINIGIYEIFIISNFVNILNFREILSKYSKKGMKFYFKVILNVDKETHDKIRSFKNNKGTYEIILKNINWILKKFNGITIDLSILIDKHLIMIN